jgi:antitoxin HicB
LVPAPSPCRTAEQVLKWRGKLDEDGRCLDAVVEPLTDADGGGWLASVPALPGCMGDGETREAALADVQNAIAEWMDADRQLGRDVPSPAALGQWRQRAPRSLHEKLKIIAAREGVSLNAFVTSVLAEAVGKKSA